MNPALLDLAASTAVRGLPLAAGACLLHLLMRRRFSAAVRHRCLVCTLAALALMPLLIACCDGWKVLPRLPWTELAKPVATSNGGAARAARPPAAAAPVSTREPLARDASAARTPVPLHELPTLVERENSEGKPPAMAEAAVVRSHDRPLPSWPVLGFSLWALVSLAGVIALAVETWRLHRLCGRARMLPADLQSRLAAPLARTLGLRHTPVLGMAGQNDGPLVTGWLRPRVLLPEVFMNWPEERQRAVLLHEFAHVLRRDALVQCTATLICVLHWFNPFAWLLLKQLRHEAECACDNVVLGTRVAATSYAGHLLAVASGGRSASVLAPSMARASGLRQRVQAVLSLNVRRGKVSRAAGLVIALAALVVSLPVMLAQTVAEPTTKTESKATLTAPANAAAKPEVKKIAVTVQTVDASDRPLGRVNLRGIACSKPGPVTPFQPEFEASTDESGTWQTELAPGEYNVLAVQGSLTPRAYPEFYWELGRNSPARTFTLKMLPGGEVKVRVLDAETRKPLQGVQVVLDAGHTGLTDADGRVVFDAVPPGEEVVKALSPPYGATTAVFQVVASGSTEVEVLLHAGFEVKGRVTNEAGQPVQGAKVHGITSGGSWLTWMERASTDANGEYRFGWLSPGNPLRVITVDHKDYARKQGEGFGAPAQSAVVTQDFVLDTGNEVRGLVKDSAGKPVQNARVRFGGSWNEAQGRWVRSDAAGRFVLNKLNDFARPVVAEADGVAPAWKSVTPGRGDKVPEVELVMQPGLKVDGRVVDRAGQPVAKVAISPMVLIDGRREFISQDVKLDEQGRFHLNSLPATGTSLHVTGKAYAFIQNFPFDPHQPVLVTMDKPAVIAGKVIDAQTRQPVRHFNVKLDFSKEEKPKGEPDPSFSASINARGLDVNGEDGRFVVESLVMNSAQAVKIGAPGYAPGYVDRVVARALEDPAWPLEIALERTEFPRLQLLEGGTLRPVGGAKVYYLGEDRWPNAVYGSHLREMSTYPDYDKVQSAISDAEGGLALSLGKTGAYTLIVSKPGYAIAVLEDQFTAKAGKEPILLEREAIVRGTVAGLKGFDQSVDYVSVDTATYSEDEIKVTPDGSFQVGGMPSGRAIVVARNPQGLVKSRMVVNLVAGQPVTVDLANDPKETLAISLMNQGKPVKGTRVYVMYGERFSKVKVGWFGHYETDEKGQVLLDHLPGVPVRVEMDAVDGKAVRPQKIDLGDPAHAKELRFEVK